MTGPGTQRYDTFDWRLHAADGTLAVTPVNGDGVQLSWRSLDGEVRHELRCAARPAFCWDLPPGAFRDALSQVIRMRRLMPVRTLGSVPGAYSSKLQLTLDPDQRADAALKRILLALLDKLEANEAGTREDLDSEFLHDFRVSVRRTRSALTQVQGVLPPTVVARFRTEFAWLQQVTGPTRDLDVYLLKLPGYQAILPEGAAAALTPLAELLAARQRQAQRAIAETLDGARYRRLRTRWRDYLQRPVPARPSAPLARRPVREVASPRIWKVYRRVRREGKAIGTRTPDAALHALRIRCKKLRYLLEFFRSLYEPRAVGGLIKALKKLQDNLGDFNDYTVQQAAMAEFAETLADEGARPQTMLAMGRLLERLHGGQREERRAFGKRFARFAAPENRALFRQLFA